jgi:hypothetical protein
MHQSKDFRMVKCTLLQKYYVMNISKTAHLLLDSVDFEKLWKIPHIVVRPKYKNCRYFRITDNNWACNKFDILQKMHISYDSRLM